RIWLANQPESDPDAVVDLATGGVALEVRRHDDQPGFRALDPATYAFRSAIRDGRPLGAAAAAAAGTDAGFDLSLALHALITERLLVGVADADQPEEDR